MTAPFGPFHTVTPKPKNTRTNLSIAVLRVEGAQVHEPGARVEFRVDGLDQPGVVLVDGLEHQDAGDGRGRLLRPPAHGDGQALVPDVELREGDGRLRALALLEGGACAEGCGAELQRKHYVSAGQTARRRRGSGEHTGTGESAHPLSMSSITESV